MVGGLGGGAGSGRPGRAPMLAEINVTPLVDVMLVLLIVFMITAPLLTPGVSVDLPETSADALPGQGEPLTVTVRADGAIFVQDTQVEPQTLVPRLQAVAESGYEQRIFIQGDKNVDYGAVADVMARINTAGFTRIGLVTDSADQ